jgi:hypothetical protein
MTRWTVRRLSQAVSLDMEKMSTASIDRGSETSPVAADAKHAALARGGSGALSGVLGLARQGVEPMLFVRHADAHPARAAVGRSLRGWALAKRPG